MKFNLIKIGDAFEFEGRRFVKTSAIVATCSETGEQKVIRRSADVIPSQSQPEKKPVFKTRRLNSADVRAAFSTFYSECGDCLHQLAPNIDSQLLQRLEEKLEKAKSRFLAKIG